MLDEIFSAGKASGVRGTDENFKYIATRSARAAILDRIAADKAVFTAHMPESSYTVSWLNFKN